MTRILIAAIALSLSVGVADAAASKHKRNYVRHHAPVAAYVPAVPYTAYPTRPVWAAPWQCFTDEGYGRFRPCDAGPTGGSR